MPEEVSAHVGWESSEAGGVLQLGQAWIIGMIIKNDTVC